MGAYFTDSRRVLISSILLFEAPSISIMSKVWEFANDKHISHSLHGSPFTGLRQLSAFASIRAVVVFPTPRGPVNKYACAILLFRIAFLIVVVI